MDKERVVSGVASLILWWVGNRRQKLIDLSHKSMAVNPFLAPIMLALGDIKTFDELAHVLLIGHFAVGHATGFGKLIDEKIFPQVFGTTKLDKAFRRKKPWSSSMFDEIDHLATIGGKTYLLSQKAGRWTIQLTMAVQLNKTFADLIEAREKGEVDFDGIVVGVSYGESSGLTDKYDIIRGINRGARHDVVDIREDVRVYAGRSFWSWLNGGEDQTQDWVMEGILSGIDQAQRKYGSTADLVHAYTAAFSKRFSAHVSKSGEIDWGGILKMING